MIGTIEHPLHPKLGKPGNPVSIVGDQGILPRNVAGHDNSIQRHQPFKYKMATIAVPDPILSPEEVLVEAIKQHAAMMSRSTMDSLLFNSHLLPRSMGELKSRCFA